MDTHDPHSKVLDRFEEHLVATGKATDDVEACAHGPKPLDEWLLTIDGTSPMPEPLTAIDIRVPVTMSIPRMQ